MARADLSRDYYADLGLTAGADINDINKQYRKLGKLSEASLLAVSIIFPT
jgi:DnaJ-domain-containing protein 1